MRTKFLKILGIGAGLVAGTSVAAAPAQNFQSDVNFLGNVKISSTLQGVQASTSDTGNVDNLSTAGVYQLRLTGTAPILRGFSGGAAGRELIVINATGNKLKIIDAAPTVTAANRIRTGADKDLDFPPNAAFRFVYDGPSALWRIAGGGGGGTEINAQAPIAYDPATTQLTIPKASSTVDGYLAKEDYTKLGGPSSLDPAQQTRLDGVEATNTTQNTRLDGIDVKNNNQDGAITTAQTTADTAANKNAAQDLTLTNHETRIGAEETKSTAQATYNTNNDTKNTAQDGRLTSVEGKNTTQDTRLDGHDTAFAALDPKFTSVQTQLDQKQVGPLIGDVTTLAANTPNSTISAGAVSTGKIADGAVSTAKIADSAVATAKIADNAVGNAKITDGAVSTAKLIDGAVSTIKLSDLGVTSAKLADGAVDLSAAKVTGVTPVAKGGTGAATATAALKNLAPTCTDQQYLKYDGTAGAFVCAAVQSGAGDTYTTNNYTNPNFGSYDLGSITITGATFSNAPTTFSNVVQNTGTAVYAARGGASPPAAGQFAITIPTIPAGRVKVTVNGQIASSGSVNTTSVYRVTDGTNFSAETPSLNSNNAVYYTAPTAVFYLDYATAKSTPTTFTLQCKTTGNGCGVSFDTTFVNSINVEAVPPAAQNQKNVSILNGDGLAGTDWQDFSMQVGGTTTAPAKPTTATEKAQWRRVGENMEIKYQLQWLSNTGGTAGSGDYLFTLPPGYQADQSKILAPTGVAAGAYIGSGRVYSSSNSVIALQMLSPTQFKVFGKYNANGSSSSANDFVLGSTAFGFSDTSNYILTFTATVPIQGWSSNVTMAKSKAYYISEKPLTRVTTTPANVGEYRAVVRGANGGTFSDTNPTNLPANTNGFQIYTVPYASAGASGQPNRFEIFVGKNKKVDFFAYSAAGKTGYLDTQYVQNGNAKALGLHKSYDPTTGIMLVDGTYYTSGGETERYVGFSPSTGITNNGFNASNGYFDLLVSEKAQVVGVERGDLAAAQITPFITEWKDFTVNVTASPTNPIYGATSINKGQWRRVGADTIEVKYDVNATSAGGGGSGNYFYNIPPGFTIDTNKQPVGSYGNKVGEGYISTNADGTSNSSAPLTVHAITNTSVGLLVQLSPTQGGQSQTAVSSGFFSMGAPAYRLSYAYTIPVTQYQGAQSATLITKDPVTSVAAQNLVQVSGTPSNLGEWRPYRRPGTTNFANGDTNVTPSTLPTAASGWRIWASGNGAGYTTPDTDFNPSRYDIFIGKGVGGWRLRTFLNPNKNTAIEAPFYYISNTNSTGLKTQYDPSTGILTVWNPVETSATTGTSIARGIDAGNISNAYFDVEVLSNPMAAGFTPAKNQLIAYGGNGNGSTYTKFRRYTTVDSSIGSAVTYTDDAALGGKWTVNEDGWYDITYVDGHTAGGSTFGITKNSDALGTTNFFQIASPQGVVLSGGQSPAASLAGVVHWAGPLAKGDYVRAHGEGQNTSSFYQSRFQITKTPSPFEVAGSGNSRPLTTYLSTAGSGTYTPPAGATRLELRMVGGGGGGGGGNGGGQGVAGGTSSFGSLVTCAGGNPGIYNGGQGNVGGTCTLSSGVTGLTIQGGGAGSSVNGGGNNPGGVGGSTAFGGGGTGSYAAIRGVDAPANSGAGGGGGGSPANVPTGSGGTGGGYAEVSVTGPSGSYAYTVGGGGAGNGAGSGGGNGGSGVIVVKAYFD